MHVLYRPHEYGCGLKQALKLLEYHRTGLNADSNLLELYSGLV